MSLSPDPQAVPYRHGPTTKADLKPDGRFYFNWCSFSALYGSGSLAEETQANWIQVQPLSQLNLCIPGAKHLDSAALTA